MSTIDLQLGGGGGENLFLYEPLFFCKSTTEIAIERCRCLCVFVEDRFQPVPSRCSTRIFFHNYFHFLIDFFSFYDGTKQRIFYFVFNITAIFLAPSFYCDQYCIVIIFYTNNLTLFLNSTVLFIFLKEFSVRCPKFATDNNRLCGSASIFFLAGTV